MSTDARPTRDGPAGRLQDKCTEDVKANVVIVEDDPLVAAHVGRGVAAHDGLSLVATTGSLAGARALLDRKVDLFILDLGLPDGSGIELIEEIRARGGLEPKILVLSVRAGADGYLLKDIDSLDIGQPAADALAMRYRAGGNAFSVAGLPLISDAALIDAGLDIAISGRTSIGISYGGQFGNRLSDQTARASLTFKF